MKTFIAVLISVLAVPAMAGTKAYAELKKGGEIVLTNDSCAASQEMRRAYWYDEEGNTYSGCWINDGRTIYFKWDNGGESRYPRKKFKVSNDW